VTSRLRPGVSKNQIQVLCQCGHNKNAHGVRPRGCIDCECRKYKERKRSFV